MMYSIKNIEEKSIPMSITQAAFRMARQLADQQPTQKKKEQVYLNTLAVCVVNDYMEMMEIPTNLRASDSWNPAMHLYADVADLKLTGLGYLECRPVREGALCYIPPEVPDNRIGVVVVKIDAELQEATLLGFTKTVRTGELSLHQLQTIDDLLEYLDRLEHNQDEVNLSQWLQNIFEVGWQSVEEILAPKTPSFAFRRYFITRGKLIDLGIQRLNQSVALVVNLRQKTKTEIEIQAQVQSTDEQAYLPPNITLKALNEEGTAVMEAHTGSATTLMRLEFIAQLGERFSLRIEVGDISITENFVV